MERKTILILDNDRDFLKELDETLTLSGYDLMAVEDPQEALKIAKQNKIDLILVDLKMPKKTGFEVAYEVSRSSHLNHIPIVAMTGFYTEEYDELFNYCCISRCLKKPFRPLDVINLIEEVLSINLNEKLNVGR
ncbi:MAG: response regulator [Candidatus Omnitrophica bacterium]|nr:response regulator [Candidatus Omnitrophota bacterium]